MLCWESILPSLSTYSLILHKNLTVSKVLGIPTERHDRTCSFLLPIRRVPPLNLGSAVLIFFVTFLSFSRQILEYRVKLGQNRSLPHPFQFTIHWSSYHSLLYNVSYWKYRYKSRINKIGRILVTSEPGVGSVSYVCFCSRFIRCLYCHV